LEAIDRHYLAPGPDHPNRKRARAELRNLEIELARGRKVPGDPLAAVAELARQRESSASGAASAERRGVDTGRPDATEARLKAQRELAAGMRLLRSAALLTAEAQLSDTQRDWVRQRWTDAMSAAITSGTLNPTPTTPLERLLLVAGRRARVSPEGLAADYGGTGWEQTLELLRQVGAVTANPSDGYRASKELTELWRAAAPRLRHAWRANPTVLANKLDATLTPLTDPAPTPEGADAARVAYSTLLDLLRDGNLAFRHWRDGWVDDAGILGRRLRGLRYRAEHSAGRLAWPPPADQRAAPVRFAAWVRDGVGFAWRHEVVPVRQRRLLARRLGSLRHADRQYLRARRAAVLLGRLGLTEQAAALLRAARAAQVAAYVGQAEARARAAAALRAVDAYPHQVEKTMRATDHALAHTPAADPLPPPADYRLREIRYELNAARRAMDRHRRDGPMWRRARNAARRTLRRGGPRSEQEALEQARVALARHDVDREYAWDTKVFRTRGGWRRMERARKAARKLYTSHPPVLDEQPVPPVPSVVIPRTDPGSGRQRNPDELAPRPDVAAATQRGRGNRFSEDGATAGTAAHGRFAVVADGVRTYPNSRDVVSVMLVAFHAELARDDRPGRTPEEALSAAHAAAAAALRRWHTTAHVGENPDAHHGAAAYLATYITDDRIALLGAGSARGYLLPATDPTSGRQLTVDHTRPGPITQGGVMTHWLGTDYQPEPTLTAEPIRGPGLLVLATDGLWRYLPTTKDLADVLTEADALTDPQKAATALVDAARAAGGVDDLTVAVILVNPRGIAPTGPARTSRPTGPTISGAPPGSAPTTTSATPTGAGRQSVFDWDPGFQTRFHQHRSVSAAMANWSCGLGVTTSGCGSPFFPEGTGRSFSSTTSTMARSSNKCMPSWCSHSAASPPRSRSCRTGLAGGAVALDRGGQREEALSDAGTDTVGAAPAV
jgi:serine/threonine protein phosphatase PrpC